MKIEIIRKDAELLAKLSKRMNLDVIWFDKVDGAIKALGVTPCHVAMISIDIEPLEYDLPDSMMVDSDWFEQCMEDTKGVINTVIITAHKQVDNADDFKWDFTFKCGGWSFKAEDEWNHSPPKEPKINPPDPATISLKVDEFKRILKPFFKADGAGTEFLVVEGRVTIRTLDGAKSVNLGHIGTGYATSRYPLSYLYNELFMALPNKADVVMEFGSDYPAFVTVDNLRYLLAPRLENY